MAYSDEFIKHLEELAYIYIEECLSNKKEMISNKGDIVRLFCEDMDSIGEEREINSSRYILCLVEF
jgi:hypothetical protein